MDRAGSDTGAKEIPPSHRLEIESTHAEIAAGEFGPGESIREVVFLATSRCRAIKGFRHFISLFRIVIPRSVELIDSSGFSRCSSLTEVIFESGSHLTRINGFRRCTALSRIVIPSSVETIDFDAFCDCTSLVEVVFEAGSVLNSIKGFRGCESLSRIALPPSLQSVHWRAFIEFDSLHALRSVFGTRVPADATLRKIKCFVTYPDESLKAKRGEFSLGFVWRNVFGGMRAFS
jgi:hypothetical protein